MKLRMDAGAARDTLWARGSEARRAMIATALGVGLGLLVRVFVKRAPAHDGARAGGR